MEPRRLLASAAAPVVSAIERDTPIAQITNVNSVAFKVTFSKDVTGVDPTDFEVARTETAGATLTQIRPDPKNGKVFFVTVSGLSGNGSLGLNLVDDDSIRYRSIPLAAKTGAADGSFTGQTYTLDHVSPFVQSINRSGVDPAPAGSDVQFTVTFSTPVTGVDADDFQLALTGTTAKPKLAVNGSGAVYTVTASGTAGSGKLGLNLVDNGTIHDLAGNPLSAGSNSPVSIAARETFPVGVSPWSVTATDANNDGWVDLVTATFDVLGGLNVLLGNGDGSYQPAHTLAAGEHLNSVAAADVNNDGRVDLVAANETTNNVIVLLGNGDGTFQTQRSFPVGAAPSGVAVADVNRDGRADIVTANYYGPGSENVSVLLGNGDGTFQFPRMLATAQPGALAVVVADVNRDGLTDLVLGHESDLSVLLGNGDGTFQAQRTFTGGDDVHPPIAVHISNRH